MQRLINIRNREKNKKINKETINTGTGTINTKQNKYPHKRNSQKIIQTQTRRTKEEEGKTDKQISTVDEMETTL